MSAEAVQRQLKEVVAAKWDAAGCHDTASLWKMVGLVDFFLPFLPLERPHLHQLFQIRLNATAAALLQSHGANLTWDPAVTTFLCDKVRSKMHGLAALFCVLYFWIIDLSGMQ